MVDLSAPAGEDWDLWSTQCRLVVTDPAALRPSRDLVDAELAGIERAGSRFHESELRRLGPGTHVVSDVLRDLIQVALEAAANTDGAVDPTVGSSLVGLGYGTDIAVVRLAETTVRVKPAVGWRHLTLDGNTLTLPPGVLLDLGATAKAYAADRCARLVHERLDTGVLVSLGGDIATAGPAPDGGWQVVVQDLPADPAQQITLAAGTAIATSSTAKRTWAKGSIHHLIDPVTGTSAPSPWRTVSVVATDALTANTASTATIVKGDTGLAWLRATGLPARLVSHDLTIHHLNGWPREEQAA